MQASCKLVLRAHQPSSSYVRNPNPTPCGQRIHLPAGGQHNTNNAPEGPQARLGTPLGTTTPTNERRSDADCLCARRLGCNYLQGHRANAGRQRHASKHPCKQFPMHMHMHLHTHTRTAERAANLSNDMAAASTRRIAHADPGSALAPELLCLICLHCQFDVDHGWMVVLLCVLWYSACGAACVCRRMYVLVCAGPMCSLGLPLEIPAGLLGTLYQHLRACTVQRLLQIFATLTALQPSLRAISNCTYSVPNSTASTGARANAPPTGKHDSELCVCACVNGGKARRAKASSARTRKNCCSNELTAEQTLHLRFGVA